MIWHNIKDVQEPDERAQGVRPHDCRFFPRRVRGSIFDEAMQKINFWSKLD